ncbi:MAG: helix-turn-helix domain-containing protein [Bacillota bacterium]
MSELKRVSYKPREIAAMTGLSKSFVYQLINSGNLRAVRIGRAVLVPAAEIERLLKNENPASARG